MRRGADTLNQASDTTPRCVHPGLLPRYRGVNTFLRSMQAGARESGFSLPTSTSAGPARC
ncbi:MAG TPA: formyltransferase family protein [Actinocrinis sp.]|nr:formyltransferase family protein [Actinocrinis sp.]